MFKCFMENKGFAEQQTNITTPNSFVIAEKPLKNGKTFSKRVVEVYGPGNLFPDISPSLYAQFLT